MNEVSYSFSKVSNSGFLKLNLFFFFTSECNYVLYQDRQIICMNIKTYEHFSKMYVYEYNSRITKYTYLYKTMLNCFQSDYAASSNKVNKHSTTRPLNFCQIRCETLIILLTCLFRLLIRLAPV